MACHSGLNVTSCSFFICVKHRFLGASPDTLIECNCCGQGFVEVKCSLVECITLSVTSSFIPDFSFLPLEAVHLYRHCSAIFLFRLGIKESKLGRYAGDKGSSFFSPTAIKQYSCKVHYASRGRSGTSYISQLQEELPSTKC